MRNMRLVKIAFHRNGLMGEGFHAVAFRYRFEGQERRMIATVFSAYEPDSGEVHPCTGRLAVLDADYSASGLLDVPLNQWRGDDFEPQIRQWIATWAEGEAQRVDLEQITRALEPA
jgi:hypothetical protein